MNSITKTATGERITANRDVLREELMLLYAEYECDRHRAIALQKQGEEMLRCAKFEQKRILRSMSRIKTLLDEECPGWEICKP